MKIKLLGSGDELGVPVTGCFCDACQRAQHNAIFQRQPAAIKVTTGVSVTCIDTDLNQLNQVLDRSACDQLFLTNYCNEHIKGLEQFQLPSSAVPPIPVYGPADNTQKKLFRQSNSAFALQQPLLPFTTINFDGLKITPLPVHAKCPSFGYLLQHKKTHVAYLGDTCDLPETTSALLFGYELDLLIIDCRFPSNTEIKYQGSTLSLALKIHNNLQPKKTILTHISHQLDNYFLHKNNILPNNIHVAHDNQELDLQ